MLRKLRGEVGTAVTWAVGLGGGWVAEPSRRSWVRFTGVVSSRT
jgi:hypothetical protein